MLNKKQFLTLISNLKINGKHSCWIFRRRPDWHGYGQVNNRTGGSQVAHRAFYEFIYGRLNKNIVLHHICETKMCVNPFHLKPLTHIEHGKKHRPKVCKKGHPMTGDNVRKNWKQRYCNMCHRLRYERYRLKLRTQKLLLSGGDVAVGMGGLFNKESKHDGDEL